MSLKKINLLAGLAASTPPQLGEIMSIMSRLSGIRHAPRKAPHSSNTGVAKAKRLKQKRKNRGG